MQQGGARQQQAYEAIKRHGLEGNESYYLK